MTVHVITEMVFRIKSKAAAPICNVSWCISLLLLALIPQSTVAAAAVKQRSTAKRRKRKVGVQPTTLSATKLTTIDNHKSHDDTLRERWVDILSLDKQYNNNCDGYTNSIRIENQNEQEYIYNAEILADKLLGLDNNISSTLIRNNRNTSLLSNELSIIWKSIAIGSSGILIGIPLLALFSSILSSNVMQSLLSTITSGLTPYLIPTKQLISSTLTSYKLQLQAYYHSLPYLLKHLNHIKIHPGPFLYKLLRKCIILEAWRHIWIRVYKTTRYLWRGTLHKAKVGYTKFMPAFIRRGIKSMFQSMVQAQVHGVVGGVLGSVLSGVSFENGIFGGSSGTSSSDFGGDDIVGGSESLLDSTSTTDISDALSDSAAQGLESTVQDLSDSVHSVVENTVLDSVVGDSLDAVADSVGEAVVESAGDAIADSVSDVVDSLASDAVDTLSESLESSIEDAVESFVDDCLTEGCLDEVVDSIME